MVPRSSGMLSIAGVSTQRSPALAGLSSGGTIEGEHRTRGQEATRPAVALAMVCRSQKCAFLPRVAEDIRPHDRSFTKAEVNPRSCYVPPASPTATLARRAAVPPLRPFPKQKRAARRPPLLRGPASATRFGL